MWKEVGKVEEPVREEACNLNTEYHLESNKHNTNIFFFTGKATMQID